MTVSGEKKQLVEFTLKIRGGACIADGEYECEEIQSFAKFVSELFCKYEKDIAYQFNGDSKDKVFKLNPYLRNFEFYGVDKEIDDRDGGL